MCGVLLGGVANIVLDIVFVFPLQMGIGGAALASAIGMVIQVMVEISHFFNEFANGFIVLLFNIQILKYCGDSALFVYSVISNCVILFNSLFTGVGQSIQPIIATNYGADQWNRIRKVRNMALLTSVIMGCLFSGSGVFFPTKYQVCKK